ncbi:hypothetical protein HBI24_222110 [Parastagonospora nodorum]|nr:hypothetical protein HBI75_211810 [Parastagonospora nodorum]KAH5042705.1 hypothetical protein HBI74_006720 [Parastagonospora nodorum]KAH5069504.1 hypothetical protein HBH96_013980 [Parastagonospora nodorum]KAH5106834.1 hypothetical protein HBH72_048080 [Parastagonospora nodorum]KAH5120952.1 hypothetical protein HBH71_066780 [Parastagonospora nodorum]
MARPQSPYIPSAMNLAGGIGAGRVAGGVSRALHPLHTEKSPSPISPKSTLRISPYTAPTPEPISSAGQTALPDDMKVEVPMAMHWTGQSDLSTDHASLSNANYHLPHQIGIAQGDLFTYAQNGMSYNDNCNIPCASQYQRANFPRSYHGLNINGLPEDINMSESYPPAVYQIEPQKNCDAMSDYEMNEHLMQMSEDYEHHYAPHLRRDEPTGYNSPYSDMTRASTPSSESPNYLHDLDGGDEPIVDKEQPYAQLIYQALRQADGHTMILRDIYEWFVKYTDKATVSETKGWQNSIRHNLSMNGAFEKVDQPCEESRKGFMWRLTKEALREGVKSTTRYRSKQPNKRGNRQHPQPQRQASGAKGGQAARRSKNLLRSKRIQDQYRSEPYAARSVPPAFHPGYANAHTQAYPPSPYYGSDMEYAYNPETHKHNNGLDLFPPSQPMMVSDSGYVLVQSPNEPLFTDSPTPSADEPMTPNSVAAGWSEFDVGASWEEGGMGMGFQGYVG